MELVKEPWYCKGWVAIIFLIFFAPIGIFLMWKYQRWNVIVKVILTIWFASIFLSALSSSGKTNNIPTQASSSVESVAPLENEEPPVRVENVDLNIASVGDDGADTVYITAM